MSKKYIYIATFALAGEAVFGFITLLIIALLFEVFARGVMHHSFETCVYAISNGAFILMVVGGLLGLRAGTYFWPILYNDDGSLRSGGWSSFKERLRGKKENDSLKRYEKQ